MNPLEVSMKFYKWRCMDGKLIYKWWIFQQTIFDCRRIAGTLVNIGMCHSLFTHQWGYHMGCLVHLLTVIVRYPTVLLSALTPCFLFRESKEFHRVPILVKPRALLLAETLCPFICLAAPWGVSRETWLYTWVYHGLFQWWDIMEWYWNGTLL